MAETEKNDGGPAFPQMRQQIGPDTFKEYTRGGMSVRDYVAAQVVAHLAASMDYAKIADKVHGKAGNYPLIVARTAYLFADALIAVRTE